MPNSPAERAGDSALLGPQPQSRYFMFSLYLAMMAVGAGQTLVFAIIPMLGRKLELHELVLKIPVLGVEYHPKELAITSLSALTALVFSYTAPKWGRLSDRLGRRKPVILVGMFGYALGTLLFSAAAWLGLQGWLSGIVLYCVLMITRSVHASVMSAGHPAASAFVVDVTTMAERTKGLVKLQTFNQLGVMLGPGLAWFVSISFLTPLFIHALLTLLVAVVVWYLLPDLPVPGSEGRDKSARLAKLSYFDPRFRSLLFIAFMLFSLVSIAQQTLGFYFQDKLGLNGVKAAQYFSLSMVTSSVSMVLAQVGVVRLFKSVPIKLALFGMPVLVLAFLSLAWSASLVGLLGAMALFGLGMGLTGPALNASATLLVKPEEQGGLAGMVGSVIGLGFVSGPLVGGLLYSINSALPYVFAAICGALLWLLIIRVERRLRVVFELHATQHGHR